VYFTLTLHPEELKEELYKDLPSLSKGIYSDIMEIFLHDRSVTVAPFAHYFEGGIRIDAQMKTAVPGLFAAGECTGGMFGANRVSAATTEMLIEGNIAGASAAAFAAQAKTVPASNDTLAALEEDLLRPFATDGGPSPVELRSRLHATTGTSLMVLRNAETLDAASAEVEALRRMLPEVSLVSNDRRYNKEWMEYLHLRNGLITAAAILKSASARKESRGVHVREDHLYTDNLHYLKNAVIKNTDLDLEWTDPVHTVIRPEAVCKPYIDYAEDVISSLS
jgi:succinate dehydrogenase/fumarate reductase flavoprotein subunit